MAVDDDAQNVGTQIAQALRDLLPDGFGFVLLLFRSDGPGDGFAFMSHDDETVDDMIAQYQTTRRTVATIEPDPKN